MNMHSNERDTEFAALLAKVHAMGRDIIAPLAAEVDRDARFPREGMQALRSLKLLGAYVPTELGGLGLTLLQIAKISEVLGHYCGSTAMIFAMHQIQVACLVHHGMSSDYMRAYMRQLVTEQRLVASATTEIGKGGDLRSSICAIEIEGDTFSLTKKAPVISYGVDADDIMVTARRSANAPASDQVHVLVHKSDYTLEPISGWDTLGFRGTCSAGFILMCQGNVNQILPTPFSEILGHSMHPTAHITWASLWLGIASDAMNIARSFVRNEARRNPNTPPISSLRLGEADAVLQTMRNDIHAAAHEYQALLDGDDADAFSNFGFVIRTNNLKLNASRLIVDVVGRAMLIVGISGYRNDSKFSLCRHLRDAYGTGLMVNNDRILNHNSTLLLMQREG
ncbi:MAG: acyl-CoA/acyl-ACP dehydrogenase [Gammaproteobacteria bacterium]|nr:acyl-CoA/acyl-ACP dehydrogenase [Gammaproteobacteria bacterium]